MPMFMPMPLIGPAETNGTDNQSPQHNLMTSHLLFHCSWVELLSSSPSHLMKIKVAEIIRSGEKLMRDIFELYGREPSVNQETSIFGQLLSKREVSNRSRAEFSSGLNQLGL